MVSPFSPHVLYNYGQDENSISPYTYNNLYYLYNPYEAYAAKCATSAPISVLDIPDLTPHSSQKSPKRHKEKETEEMEELKQLHPSHNYTRESFPFDKVYTSREIDYALTRGAWRWTARGHDRLYIAPSALRRDIKLQYYDNGVVKNLRIRKSLINYEESEKVGESVIYYDLKTHNITVFTASSYIEELKKAARYYFNHIYNTYPVEEVKYMTIPQLHYYAKEFNIQGRSIKSTRQLRKELEQVAARYFTYNEEGVTSTMPVYYSVGTKMADCKVVQSTSDKLVLLHKTSTHKSHILVFDRETGRQLNCKNPRTAKLLWKEAAYKNYDPQETVCDSVISNPAHLNGYDPNNLTTVVGNSRRGKPHKSVLADRKHKQKQKAARTRERKRRREDKAAAESRSATLREDIAELFQ